MTVHTLEARPGVVRGRFNRDFAPAIAVDSGDTVVFSTLDASWNTAGQDFFGHVPPDLGRDPDLDHGHAMTGPVEIRGARPGQVLEVQIGTLRPAPWGWTVAGPLVDRERQYTGLTDRAGFGWHLDLDRGIARHAGERNIAIPLRPFMGVMGTSPGDAGDLSTAPPRRTGGNLDCRELVAGSTLWLPIEVEGAGFFVGDGHGAQGDGEIGGTGIECPMERVELTFRVRDDMRLDLPRAQTPAGTITMGFGRDLDDAAEQALDGMLRLLGERWGFARAEAAIMASLTVSMRITQTVNGIVGVHALLPPGAFAADSREV